MSETTDTVLFFKGENSNTVCRQGKRYFNGGLSTGSCVRRPGSEDPHWHE